MCILEYNTYVCLLIYHMYRNDVYLYICIKRAMMLMKGWEKEMIFTYIHVYTWIQCIYICLIIYHIYSNDVYLYICIENDMYQGMREKNEVYLYICVYLNNIYICIYVSLYIIYIWMTFTCIYVEREEWCQEMKERNDVY